MLGVGGRYGPAWRTDAGTALVVGSELAWHRTCATQPIDLANAIDSSRQADDAAMSAVSAADALS
jgi:hypothetical protein